MRTAGVIGGLGPETTAEFYLQTVFSCFEKNTKTRPPVLIWSIPLSYQVEDELLVKMVGVEKYLPFLLDAAKRLQSGGADFVVIPCNSVHIFIEDIRKSVDIPVLSIVEETANFLKKKNIRQVGFLATSFTAKKNIYNELLLGVGINLIQPNVPDQERVGFLIKNIVTNRYDEKDKLELLKIIENFGKQKVTDVLLACTDLQILVSEYKGMHLFDSMKILALATAREILKQTAAGHLRRFGDL